VVKLPPWSKLPTRQNYLQGKNYLHGQYYLHCTSTTIGETPCIKVLGKKDAKAARVGGNGRRLGFV